MTENSEFTPDRILRLQTPVVVVDHPKDGSQRVHVFEAPEQFQSSPAKFWGVTLSDVIDHIARMQSQITGEPVATWRRRVKKRFEQEEREKARDPSRGGFTGTVQRGPLN